MHTIKQVREFCANVFPRYKIDEEGRIMRWQPADIYLCDGVSRKGWHFVGWLDIAQKVGPDVLMTTLAPEERATLEDTSIEQGVREFEAEDSHAYRFERDTMGAYVFIRTIRAPRSATCWDLARHI